MNLTLSEQLAHSTMLIECDYPDGQVGTGTGFVFVVHAKENVDVTLLITNAHVVQGSVRGRIRFTLSKNGEPDRLAHRAFTINDFPKHWAAHPDSSVDLCALPLAPYIKTVNAEGRNPFIATVDLSSFVTDDELKDMGVMEPIVMVGYPRGIWDSKHNMPVFRTGVTATHPNLDLNGRSEFLIDAACFPGSSGSPVFLYNQFGYETKSGGKQIGTSRVRFLGVLYAGAQQQITGDVTAVKIPTVVKQLAVSYVPINLGYVIKARELLAFDEGYRKLVTEGASV